MRRSHLRRLGDADADAQRLRPALRQKPRDRQGCSTAPATPDSAASRVGSVRGTR
ncbi:hypothetical protein AURDEDRAFT_161046 [Auricularia subglabra TFB-10046 SS5]|nr:hypothetical protein AURDEDRAFT_161041 [Auricularia subglabra TFB-10046 SS5]EJD50024.1 hypothetical protein AURDEDRAFT_161046 [Auricularia subglabra TFB-10046 SS5]